MRSHLLEEVYQNLTEDETQAVMSDSVAELISEAPTQEQEWLSRNIISHLQKAIDSLNIARSHIPVFISRDEVKDEVAQLQKVQNRMLEIWQNIQDVMGDKTVKAGSAGMSMHEVMAKATTLKGIVNPGFTGDRKQVKFPDADATKKFVEFAQKSGLEPSVIGNIVQFSLSPTK